MKTILARFRRVTGYGVAVFLAAVSCFSAFADCSVTWTDGPPAGWVVDCHWGGSDGIFIPAEGGGGGGGSGGGSCTNCTAMTPFECEAIRDSIISKADDLESSIDEVEGAALSCQDDAGHIRSMVYDLMQEGDTFKLFGGELLNTGEKNIIKLMLEQSTSPYQYVIPGDENNLDYQAADRWSSNNGIYQYYNNSVKEVLQEIDGYAFFVESNAGSALDEVSNLRNSVDTFKGIANGMNCAACENSSGGGGGDSGGGDSGGGGGGTTPSGCPCSEFINAVKDAVNNCKIKLDDIDTKLYSIKNRLDSWDEILKKIKDDVYKIRQTTDRMDDFFRDDTEVNFKKLIEHVLVLSNAVFNSTVKLPPNLYWTEYTNATQFLTADGSSITWLQKGKDIEAGADGAVIDFGEYGQLNWFQRMEFLLGHIVGIFSPTNSTDADFSSQEKEKAEDVQDVFDGLTFDDEKSVLNQMVSYVKEAEGSLNPFHGIFDYSLGSTRSITFLPDVSVENDLLRNTMPMITMDLTESGDGSFSISDLVDLAHNLTTFLWYVSFLIIDVLAIIKFVQCLIALNRWYWKIYNSWVSTMFSGGGR